jgi:hypothetical protein
VAGERKRRSSAEVRIDGFRHAVWVATSGCGHTEGMNIPPLDDQHRASAVSELDEAILALSAFRQRVMEAGGAAAADKKTRGARKKRPPVMLPVPTLEGLSSLQTEVRQPAVRRALRRYRQMLEHIDQVIELLATLTRPKPDRAKIDEVCRYFFEMELRDGRTPAEAFKNVVEKLKGTAFALEHARIKQLYYSEWPRRDGAPSDN